MYFFFFNSHSFSHRLFIALMALCVIFRQVPIIEITFSFVVAASLFISLVILLVCFNRKKMKSDIWILSSIQSSCSAGSNQDSSKIFFSFLFFKSSSLITNFATVSKTLIRAVLDHVQQNVFQKNRVFGKF